MHMARRPACYSQARRKKPRVRLRSVGAVRERFQLADDLRPSLEMPPKKLRQMALRRVQTGGQRALIQPFF